MSTPDPGTIDDQPQSGGVVIAYYRLNGVLHSVTGHCGTPDMLNLPVGATQISEAEYRAAQPSMQDRIAAIIAAQEEAP